MKKIILILVFILILVPFVLDTRALTDSNKKALPGLETLATKYPNSPLSNIAENPTEWFSSNPFHQMLSGSDFFSNLAECAATTPWGGGRVYRCAVEKTDFQAGNKQYHLPDGTFVDFGDKEVTGIFINPDYNSEASFITPSGKPVYVFIPGGGYYEARFEKDGAFRSRMSKGAEVKIEDDYVVIESLEEGSTVLQKDDEYEIAGSRLSYLGIDFNQSITTSGLTSLNLDRNYGIECARLASDAVFSYNSHAFQNKNSESMRMCMRTALHNPLLPADELLYGLFDPIDKYAELRSAFRYYKGAKPIIDSRDMLNDFFIEYTKDSELIDRVRLKNRNPSSPVISVVSTGHHNILEVMEQGEVLRYEDLTVDSVPDIIQRYSSGFGYPDIVFERGLTLIQENPRIETAVKSFADGFSKDLCEKALKEALEYKDDTGFEEYC